jgi:hypothetical protein
MAEGGEVNNRVTFVMSLEKLESDGIAAPSLFDRASSIGPIDNSAPADARKELPDPVKSSNWRTIFARFFIPFQFFDFESTHEPIISNMKVLRIVSAFLLISYWLLLIAFTIYYYFTNETYSSSIELTRQLEYYNPGTYTCTRLGAIEEYVSVFNVSMGSVFLSSRTFKGFPYGGGNASLQYLEMHNTYFNTFKGCTEYYSNCSNYGILKDFTILSQGTSSIAGSLSSFFDPQGVLFQVKFHFPINTTAGNYLQIFCPDLQQYLSNLICEPFDDYDGTPPFLCETLSRNWYNAYSLASNFSGLIFTFCVLAAVVTLTLIALRFNLKSSPICDSVLTYLTPLNFYEIRNYANLTFNSTISFRSALFLSTSFVSLFVGIFLYDSTLQKGQLEVQPSPVSKDCQIIAGISNRVSLNITKTMNLFQKNYSVSMDNEIFLNNSFFYNAESCRLHSVSHCSELVSKGVNTTCDSVSCQCTSTTTNKISMRISGPNPQQLEQQSLSLNWTSPCVQVLCDTSSDGRSSIFSQEMCAGLFIAHPPYVCTSQVPRYQTLELFSLAFVLARVIRNFFSYLIRKWISFLCKASSERNKSPQGTNIRLKFSSSDITEGFYNAKKTFKPLVSKRKLSLLILFVWLVSVASFVASYIYSINTTFFDVRIRPDQDMMSQGYTCDITRHLDIGVPRTITVSGANIDEFNNSQAVLYNSANIIFPTFLKYDQAYFRYTSDCLQQVQKATLKSCTGQQPLSTSPNPGYTFLYKVTISEDPAAKTSSFIEYAVSYRTLQNAPPSNTFGAVSCTEASQFFGQQFCKPFYTLPPYKCYKWLPSYDMSESLGLAFGSLSYVNTIVVTFISIALGLIKMFVDKRHSKKTNSKNLTSESSTGTVQFPLQSTVTSVVTFTEETTGDNLDKP